MQPVDAVVVNYNTAELLAACVASLRAAGVDRVIVVDNGSSDDSRSRLAGVDPEATWVQAGSNMGYGRAVNVGAALADAEYLLVCNPDLVVDPDTVVTLVERLEADPDLGLAGPRIDNPDGTLYPSARTFPNLVDSIGHGLLGLVAPENRFTRRYRLLDWDHAGPARVDWVSGACVLLRKAVFDAVGGFDPAYFMYLEDVDLCWRVGRSGWNVGYEPGARVVHLKGGAASRHPYRMLAAHHRSMWRFAWRTTAGADRLLLPVVGAGLVARLGAAAIQHRVNRS